jgi:hypothetical protein
MGRRDKPGGDGWPEITSSHPNVCLLPSRAKAAKWIV